MVDKVHVSLEFFQSYFARHIRVLLDWSKLQAEPTKVVVRVHDDLDTIRRWRMPWHVDRSGREVDYHAPDANPTTVGSLRLVFGGFTLGRRQDVLRLADQFLREEHPIHFVLPTYQVEPDVELVLDGNHRIAAAQMAGVPFKVMSFSLQGPLDARVLPDLKHWEAGKRPTR